MGILGNLLFGNRNKYNATVDDLLNNTLLIETDNRVNPNFSGVLTYLGLIDEGWHHKASAQDTAIHIAIAYYMGMVKSDSDSDRNITQALYPRLQAFIASSLSTRCVSQARADQFQSVIEKYNREYSPVQTVHESRGNSGNNRIAQEVDKDRLWKEAQKKVEEQSAPRSSVTAGLESTGSSPHSPESTLAALKATYGDAFTANQAISAYERGDYAIAFPVFKALAEQGDTRFNVGLGVMYMQGQGTPQNFDEAVRWFRKAADQGYGLAQSWLAAMYSKGMGVPLDQVLEYKWLNLAVKYWDASDTKGRAHVMHQLTLVTSSMSHEQISAGQNLIRDWKPTAPP